jgi:hypothetical protein
MDYVQVFRRHADDCRAMAQIASDPESRTTWTQMAERWLRCAEIARLSESEERRAPRKRKIARLPRVVAIQKERREASH